MSRLAAIVAVIALVLGCAAAAAHGVNEHEASDPTRDTAGRAASGTPAMPAGGRIFFALCYHAVEDTDPDQSYDAVSTSKLVQQFSWLQRNGYHPVSVDQLLAARDGKAPLPAKAVLITFDDGYESFYTRAYPILRAFHFPAVIGLVHSWMAGKPGGTVLYGNSKTRMARKMFLTWDQVREMVRSGLIEVAAHSNNLHRGILANPQGNLEPAATTRAYRPPPAAAAGRPGVYETEAEYEARIADDARNISAEIAREIGKAPRVMIWPYGEKSELAISIYGRAGMPITLSLSDGVGTVDSLADIPRELVRDDPDLGDYVSDLRHLVPGPLIHVVQVDLDSIYDPDPKQQERNLGQVVQRIYDSGVNAVFLQAYADPDGTGVAKAAYFPNKLLPMRADLFNRVAWQLRTRAGVRVYAWMPVLAFDFGANGAGVEHVLAWHQDGSAPAPDRNQPARLSPYDPKARALILELYAELAQSAPVAGILFGDDALLSDYEDAEPDALAAYAKAGLGSDIGAIRGDPAKLKAWTAFKTGTLIDFTHALAAKVREYRSPIKTARNIFAGPILDPASRAWFAQDLDAFIQAYDWSALEAMPLMENVPADDAEAWLKRLVAAVAAHRGGLAHTVFELQAVDWREKNDSARRFVPTATLVDEMRLLERLKAISFGYYPDDPIKNRPDIHVLSRAISLDSYPYRP